MTPISHRDVAAGDFAGLWARMVRRRDQQFPAMRGVSVDLLMAWLCDATDEVLLAVEGGVRIATGQARDLAGIRRLARLYSYWPQGRLAARYALELTSQSGGEHVVAPGELVAFTADRQVAVRLLEEVTVPSSGSVVGLFEHSSLASRTLPVQGRPFAELTLDPRYVEGSLTVADSVGLLQKQRYNSVLLAAADERVYSVYVDRDGAPVVVGGSGYYGVVPTGTLQAIYAVGGGPEGNLPEGSIVVSSNPAVSVAQPTLPYQRGANAPGAVALASGLDQHLRGGLEGVLIDDVGYFEAALAALRQVQVGGLVRWTTYATDPTTPANEGRAYLATSAGEAVDDEVVAHVQAAYDRRRQASSFRGRARTARSIATQISVRVLLEADAPASTGRRVDAAVRSAYTPRFRAGFPASAVITAAQGVGGVREVSTDVRYSGSLVHPPLPGPGDILRLQAVVVIDNATGEALS